MTAARLPAAVRDLLRAAPDAPGADADLLARFVAARDEAAFAALVRRHGGAVWDVCRSVLGNRADADDAFQAVFLTLARRAARLRKPASVAAWLHGVAVRVARKARAAAVRRRVRESAAQMPAAVEPADAGWAEVRAAVHEALATLPARYREPLVACYLRGLSRDATAAELGLSRAAVKKRLERGRDRLRAALVRRGYGTAVVLAIGPTSYAAVPAHLLDAAPRLAVGTAAIPHAILRLVAGGTSMTFAKLGATAALVVALGIAAAAGHGITSEPPAPSSAVAAEKPTPPETKTVGIYDRVHRTADLPGPGTEVRDPTKRDVVYYHTNSMRMWGDPKNAGKHSGLYASRDAGKTWRLVNSSFEFKSLFVHPTTGHLFAAIEYATLETNEKDGLLERYHADKAITSADAGKKWKDITPPPGYVADINGFFADPDHPGRACLTATIVRGVIFRPRNDRHSEYDSIREATDEGRRLLARAGVLIEK